MFVVCVSGSSPVRVQAPNTYVLGYWVIVIMVQLLGKYLTVGYLDP